MRLPAALVLVALFAPAAAAGSETSPEFRGGPDPHLAPSVDILAGWIEDTPRGPRFTVKVASLGADRPSRLFEVAFGVGLVDRQSVAVGFDSTGAIRSSVDTEGAWGGRAPDLDDALLDETLKTGTPGYISATIPRERFGLSNGSTMRNLVLQSTYYDSTERRWVIGADRIVGLSSFTIGETHAPLFPIRVPPWFIPMFIVACALGGGAAGYALQRWRRSRRAPDAPSPAPPAPAHEPYRMRKRPR